MFFTPELLSKRDSGIGLLWMAATLGKTSIGKLNRRNVLSANIAKLCEMVAEPAEPLALRLSSNLLVGVVRVYKVKHDIFLSEVTTCFTSLKRTMLEMSAAETSAALNLAVGSARPDTITLSAPELGIGLGIDFDIGGPIWEDFFNPLAGAGRPQSPSPGITSQDFSKDTQTQSQRPLYTLEEPHNFFAMDELAPGDDPIDLGLGLGLEDFDLGLGQDAFGDVLPLEGDGAAKIGSPGKKRQKAKSKNATGMTGANKDAEAGQIVPFEPLNLGDWAIGVQPSSSGFGLPGSGGLGMSSSRLGSVQPQHFQPQEPQPMAIDIPEQAEGFPGQVENGEGGEGGDGAPPGPAAPKKAKKQKSALQDTRTELRDDELIASRNNYLKEQQKIRIEVELRRQERDASRVIDMWMEGVPYGVNCPALDDWFKQSFKALVDENSNRRKRDEDDGFAAPKLPTKRKREETPSQGPEIGRNRGTPMNFGDEYNWGGDVGVGAGTDMGFPRGSSIEAPEMGMRQSRPVSQARDDVNASQRSSLLPWDNMGVSSSTNGDAGPVNFPGAEGGNPLQVDHVTVKLRGSSRSGRESSAAPSRLSASPGRFGPGMDAFEGEAFDLGGTIEERPTQTEVTMERNSFKFLEYARMQTRALADPSGGVMFSSIAPVESSTTHVAAAAFYHTLVLATKSAVRVTQLEPFADFAIQTL
ncbi:hypothetical protein BDV93DRAFT_605577 [Ceratobasidium sp. AG-I]|nr:hypothetical protein BDV93DRAFT_605577 [Ceratobasidium sp. AG-I]